MIEIPAVFHRIWLGDKPLPQHAGRYGETWRQQHPDWRLLWWTDRYRPELAAEEQALRPRLRNEQQFLDARDPAMQANLLRYELLLDQGGIYADVDFECRRSLVPLLEGVSAFAGKEDDTDREDWGLYSNALIGAVPHHPLLEELVQGVPEAVLSTEHGYNRCGPLYLTRVVRQSQHPFIIFPSRYFYPYHYTQLHRSGEAFPQAYAVHHWTLSWWESENQAEQALSQGAAAGGGKEVASP